MENIILTYGDIELYRDEIELLCDEYISTLPDDDYIYKNPMSFNGLLYYIYRNKLKPILDDSKIKNNKRNDYNLLNTIFFDIYKPLCFKFGYPIRILEFCTQLVNISNSHITDIKNGYYRTSGCKVNPNTTQIIKKWYEESENSIQSSLMTSHSIPMMFLLKSKFGYRENDSIQLIHTDANSMPDVMEIQNRYGNIEKPKLPELNDN